MQVPWFQINNTIFQAIFLITNSRKLHRWIPLTSNLFCYAYRISVECKVLYVAIKKLRCLKKLTKRLSKVQWLLAKSPFYTCWMEIVQSKKSKFSCVSSIWSIIGPLLEKKFLYIITFTCKETMVKICTAYFFADRESSHGCTL